MTPKYKGRFGDSLMFSMGECRILLSGPVEREQIGWHFSISCESRNPTWEEQRDTRYNLISDDVCMVSVLPPRSEYVNVHPFCFHWWQLSPKYFDVKTGKVLS